MYNSNNKLTYTFNTYDKLHPRLKYLKLKKTEDTITETLKNITVI
jgi:hypothetical protein